MRNWISQSRGKHQGLAEVLYDPLVALPATLTLNSSLLKSGTRLGVGLSGGADSVALLCALTDQAGELGLVVHAAHLHHGLRGEEADGDLEFCRELAARFGIPFHEARVDTAAEARRIPKNASSSTTENFPADSIEGTARRLRYAWFQRLLVAVPLDAIATAHTFDDQAETVLAKFLRGAWTEGLSGIHPKLETADGGQILRPLLQTSRAEIEAYLKMRGQPWREDSSNRHLTFTRNRIRHELLPQLEAWNPQLREHLAQMADLALCEESWWHSEIPRLAAEVILRGRPVRGGGRAATATDGVALDLSKLSAEPVAIQRRLLRYAASQIESVPDFAATEAMRSLVSSGKAGQKLSLARGLRVERTHRELRLTRGPDAPSREALQNAARYECVIPGELVAPGFGCRIRLELGLQSSPPTPDLKAVLRPWKPGDRVRLRYSSGPRKVKEVLERMKVTGEDRSSWPVLEVDGRILWMRGVEVEPDPSIRIQTEDLGAAPETEAPGSFPPGTFDHS